MKYLWTRLVMTIDSVICSSCASHTHIHTALPAHTKRWKSPTVLTRDTFAVYFQLQNAFWLNQRNLHPLTSKSKRGAAHRKSRKSIKLTWSFDTQPKQKYCLSKWKNGDILSNTSARSALPLLKQCLWKKVHSRAVYRTREKKMVGKMWSRCVSLRLFPLRDLELQLNGVTLVILAQQKRERARKGRSVIYYTQLRFKSAYRRKDCIFFIPLFMYEWMNVRLNVILFATKRISTWYPFGELLFRSGVSYIVYYSHCLFFASPTWMQQCVCVQFQQYTFTESTLFTVCTKLYQMFDSNEKKTNQQPNT